MSERRAGIQWHRHTGTWHCLYRGLSLIEALKTVEADGLLHPYRHAFNLRLPRHSLRVAHRMLTWRTPSEFAFTRHPRRDLALRYAMGSAPAPVAPTAQQGKPDSQGELRTG
jgi:hypothetical protein